MRQSSVPHTRGAAGEDAVQGSRTALRCVLWCLALLGCPAAWLAASLHPAWDLDAAAAAIPLVSGSTLGLLYTGTRWSRAPRAVHARPAALTLRQLLWTGLFASPFMIAIAQSDPGRLRVVDYCGTVLLLACPAALILRWSFARHARQPVDRKVYELAQNVAWMKQDMGKRDRLISAAFDYAGIKVPGGAGEHTKKRHLRPVRPAQAGDDTGPQQAVLGGLAPLVLVPEHHLGERERAQ
jgi:hypothetical protein